MITTLILRQALFLLLKWTIVNWILTEMNWIIIGMEITNGNELFTVSEKCPVMYFCCELLLYRWAEFSKFSLTSRKKCFVSPITNKCMFSMTMKCKKKDKILHEFKGLEVKLHWEQQQCELWSHPSLSGRLFSSINPWSLVTESHVQLVNRSTMPKKERWRYPVVGGCGSVVSVGRPIT